MSKACVLREKTCTVCQEHHRLRPREAEHAQLRRRLPCRAAQLHDTGELKLRGASVGLLEQRLLEHIDTGGGPEARVVVALGRLQLLRRGLRELRVVHVVVVAVRAEQRARSGGIRTLAAVVSLSRCGHCSKKSTLWSTALGERYCRGSCGGLEAGLVA